MDVEQTVERPAQGSGAVAPEVGVELVNPVSGSRTVFRATAASTGGSYVEVEATYPPHSAHPPEHLHPQQSEHFTVRAGLLHAVVGGTEHDLRPGDELEVPAGTPHAMWGAADTPTVVLWRTTPALRTDAMYCELWQVSADAGFRPARSALGAVLTRYAEEYRPC